MDRLLGMGVETAEEEGRREGGLEDKLNLGGDNSRCSHQILYSLLNHRDKHGSP